MRIETLNPDDQHALDREIETGNRIAEYYLDRRWDGALSTLDTLLDLWIQDTREAKPSANEIALGLGSLAGSYLCRNHQCTWVVITDSVGCNLGVLHGDTEWQLFPRHWIAKRIGSAAAGDKLISGILDDLREQGMIGIA